MNLIEKNKKLIDKGLESYRKRNFKLAENFSHF